MGYWFLLQVLQDFAECAVLHIMCNFESAGFSKFQVLARGAVVVFCVENYLVITIL